MTGKDASSVCLGVITGAVGIKGEVRIKPFTDAPESIAAYGPVSLGETGAKRALKISRLAKGQVVARLEGVTDRNAAEALKGTELHVARSALPPEEEDEYYHADLIGLKVETLSGAPLGKVKAVFDFGAGEILEIALIGGETALLPFTKDVVPEVLISEGKLVADPPEGALPEPGSGGPKTQKKPEKEPEKEDREDGDYV